MLTLRRSSKPVTRTRARAELDALAKLGDKFLCAGLGGLSGSFEVPMRDVPRFSAGIAPADTTVLRNRVDLVLAHVNGSDRMTVKNWLKNSLTTTNYQVERVAFTDGMLWTNAQLTSQGVVVTGSDGPDSLAGVARLANTLYGAGGNDSLTGGNVVDILLGGTGNDILNGGSGDDVYRYFAGVRYDTLTDTAGAADTLDLSAIELSAAQFFNIGNDLEVSLGAGRGVLTKNQFLTGGAVDFFLFGGQSVSVRRTHLELRLRGDSDPVQLTNSWTGWQRRTVASAGATGRS